MKFYLNNEEINVLNGATFSIKKDETLDSGKIELVFKGFSEPISPMSDLRIEDNETTYNFVVISDVVSVASKETIAYKHTLEYVQNTKKFSKIQVRNTQFSQPAKNSLKCGLNMTFDNEDDNGYMFDFSSYGGSGYSYSMEISNRHKIKNSYFRFEFYYLKSTSTSGSTSLNTLQDTCPTLQISFDVYKDNELLFSRSGSFSNGDISYAGWNFENGTYEIRNIKVKRITDYSDMDLFIVNVSLVCDVYYYTLYDVLDILRKQIALQEINMSALSAPMIYLESEYNATSKTYKIYARITNTNNQDLIATYYSSGAIELATSTIQIGSYDSEKVYIGETKSGSVVVYSYLENVAKTRKSTTTSKTITFDANIVSPNLYFIESAGTSGAMGYKAEIFNPNTFAVNVFVKYWQYNDSNKPEEYTNVGILDSKGSYYSQVFQQTKLYVECYFTKVNEEDIQSEITSGYKFIPPITYDYDLYLTDTGKTGTYALKDSQQFQDNYDYTTTAQGWKYIKDNDLYDISEYLLNTNKSTYNGKHFDLYGYQTMTIFAPNINVRYEYNTSSSGYDVYVSFENTNKVACNIYYYTEGTIEKGLSHIDNVASGSSEEILLGTITTSGSGKITAYCEYDTITSVRAEKSWSQGGTTVAPSISFDQDGDLYTYKVIIKDLNTPNADLYYRYKFTGDWSSWNATTNTRVEMTFANIDVESKTLYVEAYSSYEGIKSTTTADSVVIDGKPIAAPTINVSQYGTYSKQISITINATQSGATTSYRITKNGSVGSWTTYGGSFVLSGTTGQTDSYTIEAKTTYESSSSETTSTSFTIEGAPITYTLTVRYYRQGVFYTSKTDIKTAGSYVSIDNYKMSISGYRFSYSNPSSNFYMTDDKNLYMYYLEIVHDYQFSNNVSWDSTWDEIIELDQGTTTTYTYELQSSSTSTYSSSATYKIYDRGSYLEDVTYSVSVNKTTGAVSGYTDHNNAESLVVDYGS